MPVMKGLAAGGLAAAVAWVIASGPVYILGGLLLAAVGIFAYLWRARRRSEWPFATA